ncbi:LytS/YhcK type 5TM receptor domain-containing protein [Rhizobium esperanzae]|uniref:LytS/YhcK type 5TM receptor domain-containing protein n=1 Tax=Rhizobium esperanzae TaxID=1967781 RepID=UPI001FD94874|nr:LytS/YhcK type 5TM receptor domain-containing protein [Rhizobium esperanzae]
MHLHYKLYRLSKVQSKLGFGLMMGLGAVLSMMLSVEVGSGYYLDLRSTLLAVSPVYGGPLAVLVTVALTSAPRISMGGAGVEPALISIVLVSVSGLAVHFLFGRGSADGKKAVACAVTVAAVSLTMSIVHGTGSAPMTTLGLAMIGVKFVATFAAASVITYFQAFTLERDIKESSGIPRQASVVSRLLSQIIDELGEEPFCGSINCLTPQTVILGFRELR